MRRLLRPLALLPVATALALFVHAFTGEDHDVARGHGPELIAALFASGSAWLAWIAREAYLARRAGEGVARHVRGLLPGGGRLGVLAAIVSIEAALAFAGIEASEGRLVAALHLDPLFTGGLFAAGGVAFGALARALAAWAAAFGRAIAGLRLRLAAARTAVATPRRAARATTRERLRFGRAPPHPASR